MVSQSSSQVPVDCEAFQRSLPSTPQHQRVVLVWLLRTTAKPAPVRAPTTASYTCSGVLPRSWGFAATAASVTGTESWIISLEKGSRTLLTPSSAKPERISAIGARSRPSGVRPESSPAWWFAGSAGSPEPFQVPLAPCQLPDLSLKRLPSASTMYRPRVLSGGVQDAASAVAGAAGAEGPGSRASAVVGVSRPRRVTSAAATAVRGRRGNVAAMATAPPCRC